MTDPVVVRAAISWRDRRRFQRLPWAIYAGDPNWVPPILSQERHLLGWSDWRGNRHPFFDHAEMVTLIAERDGRVIGRIAVFVNDIHNRTYKEKRGFFGFFECIDDVTAAKALFDAGRDWLAARGISAWRGPANPSLNYTCGLLVDGFTTPPVFLMTYNPAYYAGLIEGCGFAKSQDLYAYEMDVGLLAKLVERYKPAVMSALDGRGLTVRPLDPSRFNEEIKTYIELYNSALDGTWGFTPLQHGEARQIAADLRHIITPEFAAFAMVDGKAIGAVLALLDYNQIIRTINGRLFPLGFLKLLRGRKRINVARGMAVTMAPGYQQSGLAIVLLDQLVEAAKPWKLKRWEFSWVLESNSSSRGTLERLGTRRSKVYRIYDRAITTPPALSVGAASALGGQGGKMPATD